MAKPAVTSFFRWAKRFSRREPPSSASGHGEKSKVLLSWDDSNLNVFLDGNPKAEIQMKNIQPSGLWHLGGELPFEGRIGESLGSNLRYPARMPKLLSGIVTPSTSLRLQSIRPAALKTVLSYAKAVMQSPSPLPIGPA